jgi:plastocyanin
MVASDFSRSSITISAEQTVHFRDPAGIGGTHIICLGVDGVCDPGVTGPQALRDPGFTINPGDPTHDVLFETPGAYKITCTIHPAMNLTVIVH